MIKEKTTVKKTDREYFLTFLSINWLRWATKASRMEI